MRGQLTSTAHALTVMPEAVERTIERGFRALVWRWTAARTGRDFAQVVLEKTVAARVEQLFLIHAESGLLLRHLVASHVSFRDADQVSGMLTAIREFVSGSFAPDGDGLDALALGELSVTLARGPRAVLAGVVRGTGPLDLRPQLREALDQVHRRFGPPLERFNGETTPFQHADDILEACLLTKFRFPSNRNAALFHAFLGARHPRRPA